MNRIDRFQFPDHVWEKIRLLHPLLLRIRQGDRDAELIDDFITQLKEVACVRHQVKHDSLNPVSADSLLAFAKALYIYRLLPEFCADADAGTITSMSLTAFLIESLPASLQVDPETLLPPELVPQFQEWKRGCQTEYTETQAVLIALREEYQHLRDKTDISRFVSDIFGNQAVPAKALEATVTRTLFTISCDYDPVDGKLCEPDLWEPLTQTEREAVCRFNLEQGRSDMLRYSNFPSYGLVNQVSSDLVLRLADRTGLSESRVLEVITDSVNYLPLCQLEKFIVHDSVGHAPDRIIPSIISDFKMIETMYRSNALTHPVLVEGESVCLEGLLLANAHTGKLVEAFDLVATERLTPMMANVLGEHAAIARESASALVGLDAAALPPHNSVIKDAISKLDFEGADLMDAFSLMVGEMVNQLEEWAEKNGHMNAVESLKEHYHTVYAPEGPFGSTDVFSQAFANLLLLQNTLAEIFTSSEAASFRSLGLLATLFIMGFCEGDIVNRFWDVDRLLAEEFLPLWNRLGGSKG